MSLAVPRQDLEHEVGRTCHWAAPPPAAESSLGFPPHSSPEQEEWCHWDISLDIDIVPCICTAASGVRFPAQSQRKPQKESINDSLYRGLRM